MAKLWVMDDYQGPGERKTAETLAQSFPIPGTSSPDGSSVARPGTTWTL